EASGESQMSLTDPDSRAMPKSPKVDVGYNVQTAVDAKHKLIVEQHVTNAVTDVDQLSTMAIAAKETLGVQHLKVVGDMGYYHGEESKACEEAGIEPYIAKPLTSANRKLGLYGKEQFRYDPVHDPWIAFIYNACPRTNGIPSRAHRSASQYQVKIHSTQTTKFARYGAMVLRNGSGPAGIFRCTRISPAWFRMQTYMVRACRSIPQ